MGFKKKHSRAERKKYKAFWWSLVQWHYSQCKAFNDRRYGDPELDKYITKYTDQELFKQGLILGDRTMHDYYKWWKIKHKDPETPEETIARHKRLEEWRNEMIAYTKDLD